MGSDTFFQLSKNPDVEKAFLAARDRALWDHGHCGYTGTIAEKTKYVVIQTQPLALGQAKILANQLIMDDDERIDDKWGPAGAIPVTLANPPGDKVDAWLFFGWASS